jgi:transcriptional regulator with XRE-family HTH domain
LIRYEKTTLDFSTPETLSSANQLGLAIKQARLARNYTRLDFAERSKISPATLDRIEKGDMSGRMGAWLLALQYTSLLHLLDKAATLAADPVGQQLRDVQLRKRASGKRKKKNQADDYEF